MILFIGNSISRELNNTYWGIIYLWMKFQKDFIDLTRTSEIPNTHDLWHFLLKCQLVAFQAATTNRSDIFTSDRAHRVLPPGILKSFGPHGKCSTFD